MGLAEGALILLAGILLGRFLPGRRKEPELPAAVCGCKHHHSMHDPQTGHCHGEVYRGDYVYVACQCRRYTGAEPLPSYVATEIAEG